MNKDYFQQSTIESVGKTFKASKLKYTWDVEINKNIYYVKLLHSVATNKFQIFVNEAEKEPKQQLPQDKEIKITRGIEGPSDVFHLRIIDQDLGRNSIKANIDFSYPTFFEESSQQQCVKNRMSLNQKENQPNKILDFNYKNIKKRNTENIQLKNNLAFNELENSDIFFSDKPLFKPITNQNK